MSKNRYSARIDENQPYIVEELRKIQGVTVELDCNDIIVGYQGVNFWFEIKDPAKLTKDGRLPLAQMKQSQIDLLRDWKGQYSIVSDIDEILQIMGFSK